MGDGTVDRLSTGTVDRTVDRTVDCDLDCDRRLPTDD